MPNRIPLDPKLPKSFDSTPNADRSKAQLDQWWDRPYGITRADGRIEVRCLNGGAWDRSTHFGTADDYDAACALAETKQAEWLRFASGPWFISGVDRFCWFASRSGPTKSRRNWPLSRHRKPRTRICAPIFPRVRRRDSPAVSLDASRRGQPRRHIVVRGIGAGLSES